MNLDFEIQIFAEGETRNIYSIKFDDRKQNEFLLFLNDRDIRKHTDFQSLVSKIDDLYNEKGFKNVYFNQKQGSKSGLVGYLKLKKSDLRLYCIVRSENLIIIGSGAIKKTRTRQKTASAEDAFRRMDYAEEIIYQLIKDGKIVVSKDNKFIGDLKIKGEQNE